MINNTIYQIAKKLIDSNIINNEINLPAKINFYLLKNKNLLFTLAAEIEEQAEAINLINDIEKRNKELEIFSNLDQDVKIYKVKLEDFPDDINLTPKQMDALMFMIEDEE